MIYPIRINKYLRDMRVASRKEADNLIEEELVLVNDQVVQPGYMVQEGDKVTVLDFKKEYRYLAYYKPRGLSTQDHPGKRSVITDWKKEGLYPVGRLDKDSEGLLILTNDGRITSKILSDKERYEKEYIVTTKEKIDFGIIKILESGMTTKRFGKLLPIKAEIMGDNKIKLILREGKRRQIRVMLEELSYTVESLKRVRIGDIKLDRLKPGESESIDEDKVAKIYSG